MHSADHMLWTEVVCLKKALKITQIMAHIPIELQLCPQNPTRIAAYSISLLEKAVFGIGP